MADFEHIIQMKCILYLCSTDRFSISKSTTISTVSSTETHDGGGGFNDGAHTKLSGESHGKHVNIHYSFDSFFSYWGEMINFRLFLIDSIAHIFEYISVR